jgi:hypothetical protein
LPPKTTSKIPQRYDVFKLTSASLPTILKKEVQGIANPQQVPTSGADRNILANDIATRVPLSRWLKRDEVKTKWCSRSIPLPMLQLMPQLTLQLMLQQTLQPTPLTTSSTTQLTLPTSREMPPQTQGIMQEFNFLQYRPIAQKEASVNA